MENIRASKLMGAWGYRDNGIDLVHFIHDGCCPRELGLKLLEMVAAGKELEAVIPEECAVDFLADCNSCEYAFILNLDAAALEYYRGRNTDPSAPGRYAAQRSWSPPTVMTGSSYHGVRLVKAVPFSVIRETSLEKLLKLLWN